MVNGHLLDLRATLPKNLCPSGENRTLDTRFKRAVFSSVSSTHHWTTEGDDLIHLPESSSCFRLFILFKVLKIVANLGSNEFSDVMSRRYVTCLTPIHVLKWSVWGMYIVRSTRLELMLRESKSRVLTNYTKTQSYFIACVVYVLPHRLERWTLSV